MVLAAVLACAASGCDRNPVLTPVDWWHDLQGGQIAATRPPPPGAGLPYPHLGTIPAKPELPSPAFRSTVSAELTTDRDTTEILAARSPIDVTRPPPPPGPVPAAPATGTPDDQTANATLPAAEAPAPAQAPAKAAVAPAAPDGGPLPGTPVTFVGDAPDNGPLPEIPAAPPPPASFEAVLAAPAPPALPAPSLESAGGAAVLFATGQAVLNPSQGETLGRIVAARSKGTIAVEGHGDAASDTPGAQQAALELGLTRAHAIATALVKRYVPADKILLSATAYGRDATLRIIPAPEVDKDR